MRKVVTVVFCDLSGSTALGERTDPEALRQQMRSYYERMRQILERHGGMGRLQELGQAGFRSTTLIRLAAVLYDCGQPDEAARLAVEGEQAGAAEDVVNFADGRALRARIAADQGAHGPADSLARQALGYAYKTDMPRVQATAHEALAHVLSVGHLDGARAELEHALQLWQRYGYSARAERTRALLTKP